MKSFSDLLALLGIAIAIITPCVQYVFKEIPWFVSYGGISLGVGLVTFSLLVYFFPPPSGDDRSPLAAGISTVANPGTLARPAPERAAQSDGGFLRWDSHLGQTYNSLVDGTIYTQAIQINAENVSDHVIQLEDAYIVSGETGETVPMMVATIGSGSIRPSDTNPVPPNAIITLRAEFSPPAGIEARDFFNKWKTMHLTIKYDGAVHRKLIDDKMVAGMFAGFRPNPIGPIITRRQDSALPLPQSVDETTTTARALNLVTEGSGGKGGDAKVFGNGIAIGGPGGRAGKYGVGGAGGSGEVHGDGLAAGGAGGSAGDDGVWRAPAKSGYEIAQRALGLPVDPNLRQFGRGGAMAGYEPKLAVIEQLRASYFAKHSKALQSIFENINAVPLDYLNQQLARRKESWRVRIIDDEYEFFIPRS